MTDSTINTNSSDGSLDVGGTADDLFGEIDEGVPEGEPVDGELTGDEESADDEPAPSDGGIEDQTAATVFGNLQQSGSTTDDIDDVLDDESPEDIIASADDPEPEPADDDLLVDEGALEELLLTDRTKDQEFLWIDADESETTETAPDAEASPESEATETAPDAEASPESVTVDSSSVDDAVDTETDVSEDGPAETDGPESAAASPSSDETSDENAPTAVTADGREETATPDTVEPNEESDGDSDDETAATTDLALVDDDQTGVPATTADDDNHAGGFLGWLRSKLGRLFS